MRSWQVERRKRTRHLIELGGRVMKAGIVELTGDGAMIYGALLWMAGKLEGEEREHARELWTEKAFESERRNSRVARAVSLAKRAKYGATRW